MAIEGDKHLALRWLVAGISIAVVAAGGYFGINLYREYQRDRIYSVNDTVSFPDFTVSVTKAKFKPVNLPLDEEVVAKYGGLDKHENCESQSKEWTWSMWAGEWLQGPPSDYIICNKRNDSRDEIGRYSSVNQQLVVDYKVTGKSSVKTSDLRVELIPDSGRKLDKRVGSLNVNQFFKGSTQEKDVLDLAAFGGPPNPVPVYSEERSQKYKPYHASNIGNDINKGIERTGYIYTDIRNSENVVDFKISYRGETRVVRISR